MESPLPLFFGGGGGVCKNGIELENNNGEISDVIYEVKGTRYAFASDAMQ